MFYIYILTVDIMVIVLTWTISSSGAYKNLIISVCVSIILNMFIHILTEKS